MVLFVTLAFLLAWILWLPLVAWLRSKDRLGRIAGDEPLSGLPVLIGISWFVGSWSPSIVAVVLTFRSDGGAGVTRLLKRLLEWDVGVGWNLAALVGPLIVGLAAIWVHLAKGGSGVKSAWTRPLLVPVAFVAALPFGPLGEELGWRGFGLPRLLESQGALMSALIIGVIWALWHVPLFWAPLGTSISGAPVTWRSVGTYLAEVVAVSVIMTWLYVGTDGSLWSAIAFHASWNADAHRFFFAPFSGETEADVSRVMRLIVIGVAVVLALWPGLAWR